METMAPQPTLESAMTRLKKLVYKNRIRLRDFLVDFDKLRKGEAHPDNFLRGMSMAGVDKFLSAAELRLICGHYTVPRTASSEVTEYSRFLDDVDAVFTKKHLERTPLEHVPAEPSELLDRNRYQRSSRDIGPEKEAALAAVMARIGEACHKRGILLKPFFDDAAQDDHSAKLYGHVTAPQFKQVLNVKVGIRVSDVEAVLLAEKFHHEDLTELVNYVAFSQTVDPQLGAFEDMVQ
ncbi:MAG: flagellar associated protein [Monoraphidium minutum]|nr:MAG: flagellar associated protein [Monoraphidium minutum]